MSSSDSRSQIISPFLVKAGVVSIAAFICAKLISRRSILSTSSPSSSQQLIQYETTLQNLSHGADIATDNLEDKLLELEIHVEYLQTRERDLKMQFLQYQAMKERQFMLLEIRHKMILEKIRAEFMVKEISLLQDETKRMGGLILEVVKVVQKLEDSKLENGLLERKARKLCKRGRQRLKKIKELKLRIQAREMDILNNQQELQRKDDVIHELEDQITQMKQVIHHLQRQKVEISDISQKPYSLNPKNNETGVTKEEHDNVVNEIEKLKMEANEVTYLRWSNACLRKELGRFHELNKPQNDTIITPQDYELCLCNNNNQHTFRRRRFIQKVKKWVEGSGDSKEKDNHSVCEEADVNHRNSCSSV